MCWCVVCAWLPSDNGVNMLSMACSPYAAYWPIAMYNFLAEYSQRRFTFSHHVMVAWFARLVTLAGDVKHGWSKHGFSRIPSNSNMVIINIFAICYLRVFWWYYARTMFTPTRFSRGRSRSRASDPTDGDSEVGRWPERGCQGNFHPRINKHMKYVYRHIYIYIYTYIYIYNVNNNNNIKIDNIQNNNNNNNTIIIVIIIMIIT